MAETVLCNESIAHPKRPPMCYLSKTLLELLNASQPIVWHSCADRRRCIVCEHVFRGDEVMTRRNHGVTRLRCPKCGSGPELWVRPGDPLLDENAWSDWECALAAFENSHEREDDFAEAAHG